MNGFSNDWFGNGGFRTMGAGMTESPAPAPLPVQSFTPWSHAGAPARVAAPPEMPQPRLHTPTFGPAHSFAMMSGGGHPGFLGAVRLARHPRG